MSLNARTRASSRGREAAGGGGAGGSCRLKPGAVQDVARMQRENERTSENLIPIAY
jgi:hypothetical protein